MSETNFPFDHPAFRSICPNGPEGEHQWLEDGGSEYTCDRCRASVNLSEDVTRDLHQGYAGPAMTREEFERALGLRRP